MDRPSFDGWRQSPTLPPADGITLPRLHYLDNTRALAMVAGVFLHVGLAYGENIGTVWYVQDNTSSAALEVGFWFVHLFRMALFFFVAGFFAQLVVNNKGVRHFIKSRTLAVVVPFVIFMPLVVLAINSVVLFALKYLEGAQPTLHMVAEALPTTNTTFNNFRTYHLWFIYYLAMFYAATVVLQAISNTAVSRAVRRCFSSKYSPLLVFAAIIPSHYYQSLPMPTPEGLVPALWVFGYYGVFFMYGWFFYHDQSALGRIACRRKPIILLVLISYACIYHFIPPFSAQNATVLLPEIKLSLAILQSFCAVALVLLSLDAANTFLAMKNGFLYYLSKSSYIIYLVHLPIAILIQVILAEVALNVWLKYAVALILTFAISIFVYELINQKNVILTKLKEACYRWRTICARPNS